MQSFGGRDLIPISQIRKPSFHVSMTKHSSLLSLHLDIPPGVIIRNSKDYYFCKICCTPVRCKIWCLAFSAQRLLPPRSSRVANRASCLSPLTRTSPLCLQYGYFTMSFCNTHSIKPVEVTKCSPSFSHYQNCPIPPF